MKTAHDFAAHLAALLRREHAAFADFLLALSDFDRRGLWRELGYTGLFHFLHRGLGMSKGAAHYRKTAAELVQRVPEVLEPLRTGELCITSIIELAKVLTPENREEVLPRFLHASKQEAKAVAAELRPLEAAPHRTVVTAALERTAAAAAPTPAPAPRTEDPVQPVERPVPMAAPVVPPPPAPRTLAEPLTADLRRLHVTVSKRFMAKLETAREALSHSLPGADVEAILEAGLDLLIERSDKRKGLVKRPRAVAAPDATVEGSNPRQIPAAVRREVHLRDEGRCQWPMQDGTICGSTHRIELDHRVPVARGGRSTSSNLRILCASHNDLAAREVFGDDWMDRFTRKDGRQPALSASTD